MTTTETKAFKVALIAMVLFIVFFVFAAISGCGTGSVNNMPPGSTNITPLGEGWITFELNVAGKNRKFLFRRSGMGNTSTETITELAP